MTAHGLLLFVRRSVSVARGISRTVAKELPENASDERREGQEASPVGGKDPVPRILCIPSMIKLKAENQQRLFAVGLALLGFYSFIHYSVRRYFIEDPQSEGGMRVRDWESMRSPRATSDPLAIFQLQLRGSRANFLELNASVLKIPPVSSYVRRTPHALQSR